MQRAVRLAAGASRLANSSVATCSTSRSSCVPALQSGPVRAFSSDDSDIESSSVTSWYGGHDVGSLHDAPTGRYFRVDTSTLPEATAEYYEDAYLRKERLTQPNYGCKAVQREFAATGNELLLHRPVIASLLDMAQTLRKPQISLQGWTGSGKSVALYSLVAWARANGWIALYVPSAFSMVQGGSFVRREDGLYDMPQGARYVLDSTLKAHGDALRTLRTRDGSQTLHDLATEGLATTDASAAVSAALDLKDELLNLETGDKNTRVLLAVDDYNALYHRTEFGEAVHPLYRRPLRPDELRLAAGFRLMEQSAPKRGLVVTAPTNGAGLPTDLAVPLPKGSRLAVPRLNLPETETVAAYYHATDVVADEPEDETVRRAFFLSNGNGRELRRRAAVLLGRQDALGVSLGYKAADAVKRRLLRGEDI